MATDPLRVAASDNFGELVFRARRRLGFTQAELGRRLGYKTYVSVLRIEQGLWLPGAARLDRWLDALHLSAAEERRARKLWLAERPPFKGRGLGFKRPGVGDTAQFGLDDEVARIVRAYPELRESIAAASLRERRDLKMSLRRRVREELTHWASDRRDW